MNPRPSLWWRQCLVFVGFLAQGPQLTADAPPRQAASLTLPTAPQDGDYTAANNAFGSLRFNSPMATALAPGDESALYVAERGGFIRRVDLSGDPDSETFMRIPVRLNTSGEGGLLGLAFHPNYQENGRFFTFYTLTTETEAGNGFHTRLSEFRRSTSDPDRGDPGSERILFTQYNEATNHNGGDIHFGPDGYLYVAVGDEGSRDDNLRNSQRIDRDLFAGILRLDIDGHPGSLDPNPHPSAPQHYSIPLDNPYVGVSEFLGRELDPTEVRTEFWAIGLRNPWRFTFDSHSGALIVGDVGQGTWEEINVITRGGNYGWNGFEGRDVFRSSVANRIADIAIEPVFQYPHTRRDGHTQTGISVTGGIVYRGQRYADLFGSYLFTDWGTGVIWALDSVSPGQGPDDLRIVATDSTNGIVGFGVDPTNGDPLLIDMSDGILRRLELRTTNGADFPPRLSDTGAFASLDTLEPSPGVIPYEINAPFWSDYAIKSRWFALREDRSQPFNYSQDGPWGHQSGRGAPVWIKHFELETTRGDPTTRRRLETRFLIRDERGVFGATYRWNESQNEAFLVPAEGDRATIQVLENGEIRDQEWIFPSRTACVQCHTEVGGYALGFSAAQLNRDMDYGDGPENQIDALMGAGYLNGGSPPDPESRFARIPARTQIVRPDDPSAPLAARVRAYLHTNCAPCHQPNGPGLGDWDARAGVPNLERGLIGGALTRASLIDARSLIEPGAPERSEILRRITTRGPGKMPPVGSNEIDPVGAELIREWIDHTLEGWERPIQDFESWLLSSTGSTSARVYHPEGDTDGDGWTTYWEYLQNSSPDSPTPPLTIGTANGPVPTLLIPRWPRVGVEVILEAAVNPSGPWTSVARNLPEWFYSPGLERPQPAEFTVPPETNARFYRIRLHAP